MVNAFKEHVSSSIFKLLLIKVLFSNTLLFRNYINQFSLSYHNFISPFYMSARSLPLIWISRILFFFTFCYLVSQIISSNLEIYYCYIRIVLRYIHKYISTILIIKISANKKSYLYKKCITFKSTHN